MIIKLNLLVPFILCVTLRTTQHRVVFARGGGIYRVWPQAPKLALCNNVLLKHVSLCSYNRICQEMFN